MEDELSRIRSYYDEFLLYLLHDRISLNGRHAAIGELIDSTILEGSTVLDLGCGIGISSQRIARRAGRVVGVDLSPKLIEYAQRSVPGVEFVVADFVAAELGEQFDTICLFDVMEHVPAERRPALWAMLDSHLTPSGILIINAPHPSATAHEISSHRDTLQIVDEILYPDVLLKEARELKFLPREYRTYGVDRYPQYFWLVLERAHGPVPRQWPRFAYLRDRLRTRLRMRRYVRVADEMLSGTVTAEVIRKHRSHST